MKTKPITPATVAFDDQAGQPPRAPLFDDIYHPRAGALVQARHVYLQGNDLPQRWQGRRSFVVLETGFGLGNNFLATWEAWRADPLRCDRLHYVSIERHPLNRADLARAHQQVELQELANELLLRWPAPTPNLHTLNFDGGRVQLLLALGDVDSLLPALRLQADAFFLDGFAPDRNSAMWHPRVIKALGRKAAIGATLTTWTASRSVRDALRAAGFSVQAASGTGGQRNITLASFEPPSGMLRMRSQAQAKSSMRPQTALVVGAGLAGAAVARALAQQGLQVTVLEAQSQPAAGASGNEAGLFHGSIAADDGPYSRLYRAAALAAASEYALALQPGSQLAVQGHLQGQLQGLLRLEMREGGLAGMQALLQQQACSGEYVQALDAASASAKAGVPLPGPAWFFPQGGWINPALWVRHALNTPGVQLRCNSRVEGLRRKGRRWQLELAGADGQKAEQEGLEADLVVLCNTASADTLLQQLGHLAWPLSHTRGQVTRLPAGAGGSLLLPVAGDGYALPLPALPGAPALLLCGATRAEGQPVGHTLPAITDEDHQSNLQRLGRWLDMGRLPAASSLQGRAAWRLNSDDRLPIAGALPCVQMPEGQRMDQVRMLPREPGLFVLTALGARGLTLAPLLAQLVAAQACDAPWPLEQDLADAVDPARWRVRLARQSTSENRVAAS